MIEQFYGQLREWDERIFLWCNGLGAHPVLDRLLRGCTFLGGAFFTIGITLSVALFVAEPLATYGWKSFAALTISHLSAVCIKRRLRRMRPYDALPQAKIKTAPLRDFSFPSGHTTAAFSTALPLLSAFPWGMYVALPLACLVGLSRVYLGVHYPSDCAAGALLGLAAASLVIALPH
jgi:undecaprenyl-diphosphatase